MKWNRRGWIGGVLAAVGGRLLGSRVAAGESVTPVQPDLLRCSRTMRWIALHWPELAARIPAGSRHFEGDRDECIAAYVLSFEGASTYPPLARGEWITSYGWKKFIRADVPDRFFACCDINRGGSGYLCAMWRDGERRFWFYDQYVVTAGINASASPARTRKRLRSALSFWDDGRAVVCRSGILECLKPATKTGRWKPGSGS